MLPILAYYMYLSKLVVPLLDGDMRGIQRPPISNAARHPQVRTMDSVLWQLFYIVKRDVTQGYKYSPWIFALIIVCSQLQPYGVSNIPKGGTFALKGAVLLCSGQARNPPDVPGHV